MDVNEELKFFVKIPKKIGGGGVWWGRVGLGVRGSGGEGLGWGGGGGQGGCDRRIFWEIHKKKISGLGGRFGGVGSGGFGLGCQGGCE